MKKQISVPVGNNETKSVARYDNVNAEIIGPFGIHESIAPITGYTVTHLPSGFAAMQQIPTLDDARAVARDLIATRLDWTFTDWRKVRRGYEAAARVVRRYGTRFDKPESRA